MIHARFRRTSLLAAAALLCAACGTPARTGETPPEAPTAQAPEEPPLMRGAPPSAASPAASLDTLLTPKEAAKDRQTESPATTGLARFLAAPATELETTGRAIPDQRDPPAPEADPMKATGTLLPAPVAYAERRIAAGAVAIPPHAKFLKGVVIAIDPGHGGQAARARYKRGPTGVREAEMNLRVARYLRRLLEHVGAEVHLTRETDVDSTLAERARFASSVKADLFMSLHHNAVDNRPHVDYTTVWCHGPVDGRPSNLDFARHLSEALHARFPRKILHAVPIKTDLLMSKTGFGVLRNAEVTACLTESSFFSHPPEEQRLRSAEYNFLEAETLFHGLANYAFAGLPRARFADSDTPSFPAGQARTVRVRLDDGLRSREAWGSERRMILSSSVAVSLKGQALPYTLKSDERQDWLLIELPALEAGEHTLRVDFMNQNKSSNLEPRLPFMVAL